MEDLHLARAWVVAMLQNPSFSVPIQRTVKIAITPVEPLLLEALGAALDAAVTARLPGASSSTAATAYRPTAMTDAVEEVNARLERDGLRTIDPSDSEMAERYGMTAQQQIQ
jgi:hypothetical protein